MSRSRITGLDAFDKYFPAQNPRELGLALDAELGAAIKAYKTGAAARECRHCGDMMTPDRAELGFCTARGGRAHELIPAGEVHRDFYRNRDEAISYVLVAALNLRLAAEVIAQRSPEVSHRVVGAFELERGRLHALRAYVMDSYAAAEAEAEIVAGSLEGSPQRSGR
jgi:hypothetical protein